MKTHWILLTAVLLAGCAQQQQFNPNSVPADPTPLEEVAEKTEGPAPQSILEPQDGSDEGFKKGDGFFFTIGEGVTSLGDVTREGLWVKAPFVENNTTVEIHSAKTKTSVLVEAIQSDGFMQMSLAAFQALGVSPAELTTIEVRTP
jgi:hypothetical protein